MNFYEWLHRWRWPAGLFTGALCLLAAWQALYLPIDPSDRSFYIRSGAAFRQYRDFVRHFGSDETIVVGIRMPGGLTPEMGGWLSSLSAALRALPGVEEMHSLATVRRVKPGLFWGISARPLLADLESRGEINPVSPESSPEERLLLSKNGRTTAIVLKAGREMSDPHAQHRLILDVRRQLAVHRRPDVKFMLTGTVVEQDALLARMNGERLRFIPYTVIIVTVLLYLLYRNWRAVLYPLLVMGGALAATEGVMNLCGFPLNVVTGLLAPIVMIVAVSLSVQIASGFLNVPPGVSGGARLRHVYHSMFMPCLLACLTTIVGFYSLFVSPVPALREFGWFGGFGTMVSFALAMAWLPLFSGLSEPRASRLAAAFHGIGRRLGAVTVRDRWLILAAAAGFAAAGMLSATSLRASTNLLHIFRAGDAFRAETESVQRSLGVVYPLELELTVPAAASMTSPVTWKRIERFQNAAAGLPVAARTFSLADVIRYIERAGELEPSERTLKRILRRLPEEVPGVRHLAGPDYHHLRMTLYLRRWETAEVMTTVEQLRALSAALLPGDWRVEPTGHIVLLSQMSQHLVNDQVQSTALAFGLILLMSWAALRSFSYAVISLVPNVLPIIGLFGLMAAWDIPLNVSTAMIASVAIGLIFDNTIQFIYRFRDHRRAGSDVRQAVSRGFVRCAQPMISSSLIVAAGFAVTFFGEMMSTLQFGQLTCATIGLAMAGDMIVLPALLAVWQPREKGRGPQETPGDWENNIFAVPPQADESRRKRLLSIFRRTPEPAHAPLAPSPAD